MPGTALELEITESVIMIDPKRAREVLEALRALGLRLTRTSDVVPALLTR